MLYAVIHYHLQDSAAVATLFTIFLLFEPFGPQTAGLFVSGFLRQFLRQITEQLIYTDILLGTDFEVLQALSSSIVLSLFRSHFPILQVYLIAYDTDEDIGSSFLH